MTHPKNQKGMNNMSERNIYFEAEKKLLDEIENEKHIFSFRSLIRLITANSIASKLR